MNFVLINKHSKIVDITLNRPEKKNALNVDLLKELLNALLLCNQDKSIRSIIIKGAGNCFSSGLDLNEALNQELISHSSHLICNILKEIYFSPHVTLASIEGPAIAGGCGIMCACDFAIADEHSIFGFPEVRKGLVPALVSVLLKEKLLFSNIRELLLLGEIINAKKAFSIGLIHAIVDKDPYSEVSNFANKAIQGGPEAIKTTKSLLRKIQSLNTEESFNVALKIHEEMRTSKEAQEGLSSFKEKRLPNWIENENS